MKISLEQRVAILIALGFPKAGEWDDKKVISRSNQVPGKIERDKVPEEHQEVYDALLESAEEGDDELDEDEDEDAAEEDAEEKKPAKKKKKAKAAPAEDGAADISEMNLAELRTFAEENNLKVSKAGLKNVMILRAEIKKALKSGSKSSKVDKAVDSAAKKGKGGKRPAKDDDDEDKPGRELDEYGSTVGSIRSKVNLALTDDWQSDEAVAETAGVSLKQARSRLRRAARKGLIEVRRLIEYRHPEKKK